jgi:xylulokinase
LAYLGIDLGTSGLRALLVDADGTPLGAAAHAYDTRHPHPGWSEQDPADWIAALDAALADLRAAYPAFATVRGVAVSGHMHGAVTLDDTGAVIRPCILWNDTRSAREATALDATPGMRAQSGNIVFPGFTAPKLEWLRTHEPANHARVARVLLPASYLNWHLTGEYVADMSDAAGTSWLDIAARDWSDDLLAAGHMRRAQMPRLVEGCAVAGHLRPALARAWGLSGPVVVAGGAGDNAAAACGIGALGEGRGFVSLGTSGVLLVARDGCHPAPETALHTFCHAVPGRWYQMGVMLSATDSLNWLSRISGQSPAALTNALGDRLRPPGPERFLPYLSGERTPHNDATIRAAFTGLSARTGLPEIARAVLEGVAFGLRDSAEAMHAASAGITGLHAIGGGAASLYWVRLLATVLGVPLTRPRGGEYGAALGAARLAMVAATGAPPDTVMHPPVACETIDPDTALAAEFDAAHAGFKAAYPAIRSVQ